MARPSVAVDAAPLLSVPGSDLLMRHADQQAMAAIAAIATYSGKSQALMNASEPRVRASAAASPGRRRSQRSPGAIGDATSASVSVSASVTKGSADTCACRSPSRKLKTGTSVMV